MSNPKFIKDRLPLMSMVNDEQMAIATKNNIPLMRGVLYEVNDDGYGNDILNKINENTVVFGGAVLALEHLTNVTASFKPATLNEIYNVNADIAGNNSQSFISLFGVGMGGAALDFGSVKDPSVKQREILDFIPLRSCPALTGTDADKYFFKKDDVDGVNSNWYLKEFESATVVKSLWKDAAETDSDGTEITEEIYESTRTEGIESFAEFKIKLNVNDVREYFESIGELDMARYNAIGLFTGQKVAVEDGQDYVNVRLFSVVNFENNSVKEKKESQYIYRVYSLV